MKNLTWQNPEQLFVAQELINKVKSKCCGIKVYQDIYKKHIKGPKKFFVPKFIDKLMHRFGDAELYDKQLSYRNSIISDEPGIQELMKIIDKEHKGLEQEIFNSKEYKKYTD